MSLALVAPFPPPSACVVCSLQDLWWVPLPGPRAPRYPCLSPTWSLVIVGTVLRCYDFFCATRGPSSALFTPSRSPSARSLCAARPPVALWGFVLFFLCRAFCRVVPSSLHARTTTLHSHPSRLRSVLTSSPIAFLWRGPWRSPAMPGGRPSLPSQSFKPSMQLIFFLSSPPSPPLCLLPALLLLFSCSVQSPLAVPAPSLYLARFHAPQGLRPVFRPVG